jgi:hypothetical protein
MEIELSLFRQQVATQQAIITQLLSLNSSLQQKLKEAGINLPDDGLLDSNSKAMQDTNELLYSNSHPSDGIKQPKDSKSQAANGINHLTYFNSETANGINEPKDSISASSHGINQLLYSNSRTADGIKGGNHALPHKIALTERNVNSIALVLRHAKLFHIRLKHLPRIAKLFIHLYNGGGGRIAELTAATGHSKSGMAKLLMNLRQRGLVVKHRVRNHQLSAGTIQLLSSASLEP